MNRTAAAAFPLAVLFGSVLVAQGKPPQDNAQDKKPPASAPAASAQDPAVAAVLARIKAAEAAAKTVAIDLHTVGQYPGGSGPGAKGLSFETKGTLRVLRGEHPATQTVMEFTFEDGLAGRMESVRTEAGVQMLENNPTFGEVFLQIDPATVEDLEWAGDVLHRGDLPGMGGGQSQTPLGSGMIEDLARQYALAPLGKKDRNGQEGQWFGGDLRGEIKPEADPDVPLADRVELFVRTADMALLEVVHLQQGKVLQRIEVTKVEVDRPMAAASFAIDAHGQKPRDVSKHRPAWEQIQQVLKQAEERAGEGVVRPSRRAKAPKDGDKRDR